MGVKTTERTLPGATRKLQAKLHNIFSRLSHYTRFGFVSQPNIRRVEQKRCRAGGCIVACSVEIKRSSANSSIEIAGGVGKERKVTNRDIVAASGGASKCVLPFCRVAPRIAAIRRRTD